VPPECRRMDLGSTLRDAVLRGYFPAAALRWILAVLTRPSGALVTIPLPGNAEHDTPDGGGCSIVLRTDSGRGDQRKFSISIKSEFGSFMRV